MLEDQHAEDGAIDGRIPSSLVKVASSIICTAAVASRLHSSQLEDIRVTPGICEIPFFLRLVIHSCPDYARAEMLRSWSSCYGAIGEGVALLNTKEVKKGSETPPLVDHYLQKTKIPQLVAADKGQCVVLHEGVKLAEGFRKPDVQP